MSKFIHVDGDDGRITVKDGCITGFYGWVYEVPNNYRLDFSLERIENQINIYNLLDDDERAVLVRAM